MWCYPTAGSFKIRMRQVRKNYDKWLEKAKYLQEWVCEEFEYNKMHQTLLQSIEKCMPESVSEEDVNVLFEQLLANSK